MAVRNPASVSLAMLGREDDATLFAVAQLRYAVYVSEMGCPMKAADHDRRVITDELDRCSLIVVASARGEEIVGAVRNTRLADLKDAARPAFDELRDIFGWEDSPRHERAASFSSKLTVRRDYRQSTVAARLAADLYGRRFSEGTSFDYLLAPSSLVPMYVRLGYVHCAMPLTHAEAGPMVPMRLAIQNITRLRALRSPFARVARAYISGPLGSAAADADRYAGVGH